MNGRSLSILLISSERIALTGLRDRRSFPRSIRLSKQYCRHFFCPDIKHPVLGHFFNFGLDIFRFESFESQNRPSAGGSI
jgi:hypothetical protein